MKARSISMLALALCLLALPRPASAGGPSARTIDELDARLDRIAPRVKAALRDRSKANSTVAELDQVESDFARIAPLPGMNREQLVDLYARLEGMLRDLREEYVGKADSCAQL